MPDPANNSPFEICVSTQDERWTALVGFEALASSCVKACVAVLATPQSGELSIALVDDAQIQQLNRDYRGKDKPTNVLSFPSDGFNPAMGDIVLSFETVQSEASAKDISFAAHTCHLLVHGYLHLSGYDHARDDEAEQMEALEIKILRRLSIDNPYQTNESQINAR